MLILAAILVLGAMGAYVFTQSRAPVQDGNPAPVPMPRDPLLEARDHLKRQIEIMECRNQSLRQNTRNDWSEDAVTQLRAELDEVERQLGENRP